MMTKGFPAVAQSCIATVAQRTAALIHAGTSRCTTPAHTLQPCPRMHVTHVPTILPLHSCHTCTPHSHHVHEHSPTHLSPSPATTFSDALSQHFSALLHRRRPSHHAPCCGVARMLRRGRYSTHQTFVHHITSCSTDQALPGTRQDRPSSATTPRMHPPRPSQRV